VLGVAIVTAAILSFSTAAGDSPRKTAACAAVSTAETFVARCGLASPNPVPVPGKADCSGAGEFDKNSLAPTPFAAYELRESAEWVVVFRYSESSLKDLGPKARAAAKKVARAIIVAADGRSSLQHVEVVVSELSKADRAAARCTR